MTLSLEHSAANQILMYTLKYKYFLTAYESTKNREHFYKINKRLKLSKVKNQTKILLIQVLYMSFDKFLLAVESHDLFQADKSIIILSLNDKIYSYTKKPFGKIDALVNFIIQKFARLESKNVHSFCCER